MSAPFPPIPPNIAEIIAPSLLGGIWNWCLYGTLVVQFYVYSYNFPTDSRFLKLLVSGVFLIETLQTALNGADLYYWFASGFGNLNHLASPYTSPFNVPMIGAIVSLTVQFYFAHRIWLLGNKEHWWLPGIIGVISTVDASAAFAGGIYTQVRQQFARGRWLKILVSIWLVGNTLADTIIASAMLYYLIKLKRRDGHFSSHTLISIVRLTVETNILTTTVSIVGMVFVLGYSDKSWLSCPTAILGKLYSNTLLVSLNNRISIRDTMTSRGAIRSPPGSFPESGRSEGSTDIVLTGFEKPPSSIKTHPFGERDAPSNVSNVV